MLCGVHAMLAIRTNTPELVVEEVEMRGFLKAAQNVARHYDVQTTQKTMDWIAFMGACGSVYGTRAFAIAARKSAERQNSERSADVLQFRRPVRPAPVPPAEPAAPPKGGPEPYTPSVVAGDHGSEEFSGF